jgi:hypothetical protein
VWTCSTTPPIGGTDNVQSDLCSRTIFSTSFVCSVCLAEFREIDKFYFTGHLLYPWQPKLLRRVKNRVKFVFTFRHVYTLPHLHLPTCLHLAPVFAFRHVLRFPLARSYLVSSPDNHAFINNLTVTNLASFFEVT